MKRITCVITVLLLLPLYGISQTIEELNKPMISALDEVAPFHEELAAVRKGNEWGFIDKEGNLVIDFRADLVWNKDADTLHRGIVGIRYPRFKEGRCLVKTLKEEEIPYYGFMDKTGKIIIEPEYLNITEFENGNAIGIYCKRTYKGKNNFQLNIYDYTFTEVIVNMAGEIIWPIEERDNILMSKRRYQLPELWAKLITPDLLLVKKSNNKLEILKVDVSQ